MDIKDFDLNLLLFMDTLLKERSVTGAARRLGISQPTASASLQKLRVFFGDELFVRQGRLLEPTPRALALTLPIDDVLRSVQANIFDQTSFVPETSTRRFTIMCGELGQQAFLPTLMPNLRAAAPSVSLRIVHADIEAQRSLLERGTADLALGHYPGFAGPNVFQRTLYIKPMVCVLRQDHPRLVDGSLPLDAFRDAEHAVAGTTSHLDATIGDAARSAGVHRHVTLEMAHMSGLPQVLIATDLIAVVPDMLARTWSERWALATVPVPFPLAPFEVRMYWDRKVSRDPAVQWLRSLIATLFSGTPA